MWVRKGEGLNIIYFREKEKEYTDSRYLSSGFYLLQAVEKEIKSELIRLRHHWNKHEPRMFERVAGLSDHQLAAFEISKDLVEVRSGVTAYGSIIFGKIKIPEVNDANGEGFVHVR